MSRPRGQPMTVVRAPSEVVVLVKGVRKARETIGDAVGRVLRLGLRVAQSIIDVMNERLRQDGLWGVQNHPLGLNQPGDQQAMIDAQVACDRAASNGTLTYRHIAVEEVHEFLAAKDLKQARTEAVQVAAVFVAIVERIDRMSKNGEEL